MAVVGVDVGTQSLKAVVVDAEMRVRGEAAIPYQPSFPQPGWAEQDPGVWLASLRPAIGRALGAAELTADNVKAIGVTGQLDGCIPTGADGSALGPCIIWMDRRATEAVAGISAELVRRRAGIVLDPGHMAAKIGWSRRHLAVAGEVATWHQPVSFVVANLCGRAVMDHALASTTMLYGLAERGYADELLEAFAVDKASLPEIDDAAAPAGRLSERGAHLTGLCTGTIVAVGTGDDFANAIGAGVTEPGIVACNLGTGEALGAVSRTPAIDPAGLVETHGYLQDRFFISNPGWLCGGSVAWFCSAFGIDGASAATGLAARAPAGSDGLIFLPALSGAMAPRWLPEARGVFFGLSPRHGREACARAVLEGCAFAMRDVVDRLDELGVAAERIRLTGGGARSRLWAQIRADVANRPVELGPSGDAAPVGAAVLAAIAAGLIADASDVSGSLLGGFQALDPEPASRATYDDAHFRYRELFEALAPLFDGGRT